MSCAACRVAVAEHPSPVAQERSAGPAFSSAFGDMTRGIKMAALQPALRRPSSLPLARDRNSLAGLSRIDGPGSS